MGLQQERSQNYNYLPYLSITYCFTNIKNKDAALVIRDVANGVINIDEKIDFYVAKEYLQEFGYYEERDEY